MSSQVRRDKDWLEKDQNSRARGHVERRKRKREWRKRDPDERVCVARDGSSGRDNREFHAFKMFH